MDLPTTLKIYSHLAGVFIKLGKIKAAREYAEAVMRQLAKAYSVSASVAEGGGKDVGSKWWTSAVSDTVIPGDKTSGLSSRPLQVFPISPRCRGANRPSAKKATRLESAGE
jgi:hypothetical protein